MSKIVYRIFCNQQLRFSWKTGLELQNPYGNFEMVKMNGKTLLISHLIIENHIYCCDYGFYSFFAMKQELLIRLMLFWTSFTADIVD